MRSLQSFSNRNIGFRRFGNKQSRVPLKLFDRANKILWRKFILENIAVQKVITPFEQNHPLSSGNFMLFSSVVFM